MASLRTHGDGGLDRPRPGLILVAAGAVLGLLFSGFSTFDFAQHLDRQVHGVHCSFLPGLTGTDAGVSGCQEVMMSPYSSVFRTEVWGGIPISLPAMSVFAFLLFLAVEMVVSRRQGDRRATGFLALATALPALTSAVMAFISLHEVGAACKLCVGVYIASALGLLGGLLSWRATGEVELPRRSRREAHDEDSWDEHQDDSSVGVQTSNGYLAGVFAAGVAFVALPLVVWSASVPDHSRFVGACGVLDDASDTYGTLVPMGPRGAGGAPAIEVLDPLCPACRAFERRLSSAGLDQQMDRQAALFPLDNTCNWMVKSAIHPGACKVSEAVLCAGERAGEVVSWAFEEQDHIREAAAKDPSAALSLVTRRFPELAACMGSAQVRSRLNRSLRWAVRNRLSVLTPQLYVAGVRLCDEDVDLGLDFALSRMIERHRAGTLQAPPGPPAAAASPPLARQETERPVPVRPDPSPAGERPAPPTDNPPLAQPEEPSPEAANPTAAKAAAPTPEDSAAARRHRRNPGDQERRKR